MNPSTALATVLVDELVRCGVRDAVLCPGSRNGPLAFAFAARPGLRLHVRIDERTAGFLALGLAARSGRPVPVCCTSGTAAANLHPAALEADHAGVPLLLVTADRPAELVGTGANQTVRQAGLYGAAVREAVTFGVAERRAGQQAGWRSAVCRAVASALGDPPGPVQLNVPFREPLVPDGTADWPEPLDGRPDGRPWTTLPDRATPASDRNEWELGPRTLVIAGHGRTDVPEWLRALPRVAEPGSPLWDGSLAAGPWLLGALPEALRPDDVIVVGRPTLHRPVQRLLADPAVRVTVLTDRPQWTDVAGSAHAVHRAAPAVIPAMFDEAWIEAVRAADGKVAGVVRSALATTPWPTGLAVARDVTTALPAGALLVLGSSNPVRDIALAATPREDVTVHANRGVAGIDGTVSTAIGAALAHGGPSYALLGDLTFLHDANGLVIGPDEPRPDLTIVVLNDDGGGIFTLLEQGAPEHATTFERIFGTPHGTDLTALAAATNTPYTEARTSEGLCEALTPATGIRVVEVKADRQRLRDLHATLRAAVAEAL